MPLVPVAPASAALDPCTGDGCRDIALFLRAETAKPYALTLSTLPGDAPPGTLNTFAISSVASITVPLAADVVVPKEDAFRVELPGSVAGSRVYAVYEVHAETLLGDRLLLARAEIGSRPNRSAEGVVQSALEPTWPILNPTRENLDQFFPVEDAAGYTVNATYANALYDCAEARGFWAICDQQNGDYGVLTARTCRPGSTAPTNPLNTLHVVTARLSEASRSVGGPAPCERSAAVVANQTANDTRDAWNELAVPLPRQQPPEETEIPDWRSVSLNATPDPRIPQGERHFTVPSGARLNLTVRVESYEGTAPVPPLLRWGTKGDTARLVVRTSTSGAFGMLAEPAAPILPGTHTMQAAHPDDAKDFALDVPAGYRVEVAGVPHALYGPDGETGAAAAARAGRWTLRAFPAMAPESALRVTFKPTASEGDGGMVDDGVFNGTLGYGDDSDEFGTFLYYLQDVTLRIEHPPNASYRVVLPRDSWGNTGATVVAERVEQSAHEVRLRHARANGTLAFAVARSFGEGSYQLYVDRDEGGNLSSVPFLQVAWEGVGGVLLGYEGGVVALQNDSLHYFTPTKRTPINGSRVGGVIGHARTAEGEYVGVAPVEDPSAFRGVVLLRGGERVPLVQDGLAPAFGADGTLFVSRSGDVVRLAPEGNVESIPIRASGRPLIAAPDGTIYTTPRERWGPSNRLSPNATAFETLPDDLNQIRAFDAAGRAYRLKGWSLVERVDLTTGERQTVFQAPGVVYDIAFGGNTLYALVAPPGEGRWALAYAPLSDVGFEGFRPAFTPPPPPDLVATSIALEPRDAEGIEHLLVGIANQAPGWAPATTARLTRACSNACTDSGYVVGEVDVPALAAGEATIVRVPWRPPVGDVGNQTFKVDLDIKALAAEADENNVWRMSIQRAPDAVSVCLWLTEPGVPREARPVCAVVENL